MAAVMSCSGPVITFPQCQGNAGPGRVAIVDRNRAPARIQCWYGSGGRVLRPELDSGHRIARPGSLRSWVVNSSRVRHLRPAHGQPLQCLLVEAGAPTCTDGRERGQQDGDGGEGDVRGDHQDGRATAARRSGGGGLGGGRGHRRPGGRSGGRAEEHQGHTQAGHGEQQAAADPGQAGQVGAQVADPDDQARQGQPEVREVQARPAPGPWAARDPSRHHGQAQADGDQPGGQGGQAQCGSAQCGSAQCGSAGRTRRRGRATARRQRGGGPGGRAGCGDGPDEPVHG
jgi:hypothetical protein